MFGEDAGNTFVNVFTPVSGILQASNIYFYFDVNPANSIVTAKYSSDADPAIVPLGSFTISGNLAAKLQGFSAVAVGLIAHSGSATTYQAKYDFMNIVTNAPAVANPISDQMIDLGTTSKVISIANVFTDDNGAENLSFEITQKIQTEMTYPGQIKVTVIREKRAVNVSR